MRNSGLVFGSGPSVLLAVVLAVVLAAGCGGSGNASGDGGSGNDGGNGMGAATEADLQFCVDENNRYRDMVSKPHFARSATLEAFALVGAMTDGAAMSAHKHFIATGGGGISFAENEIPWWPKSSYGGTVQDVMRMGIQLMWNEGPGTGAAHGHYTNMTGAYTQLGCGADLIGDLLTVTIDFK